MAEKVRVWTIRELRWKDKVTGEEIDDLTPGMRHALVRDEIPVAALPDLIEALRGLERELWELANDRFDEVGNYPSPYDEGHVDGLERATTRLHTFIDTLTPREENK